MKPHSESISYWKGVSGHLMNNGIKTQTLHSNTVWLSTGLCAECHWTGTIKTRKILTG